MLSLPDPCRNRPWHHRVQMQLPGSNRKLPLYNFSENSCSPPCYKRLRREAGLLQLPQYNHPLPPLKSSIVFFGISPVIKRGRIFGVNRNSRRIIGNCTPVIVKCILRIPPVVKDQQIFWINSYCPGIIVNRPLIIFKVIFCISPVIISLCPVRLNCDGFSIFCNCTRVITKINFSLPVWL